MLHNKNVIIYGAAGSLGSAVAKAMAAAGARVYLTGRDLNAVQKLADHINAMGSYAEAVMIDALNKEEIDAHLQHVVKKATSVDISFNLIGYPVVQGVPLTDISADDFVSPMATAMRTQFLTATAAAKIMTGQKSGVILSLTATPGGIGYPNTGGFAPACSAIETLSKNLAAELGAYGIRVVNIRSGGSPDSKVFKDAVARDPGVMKNVLNSMMADTMLKRLPAMAEIANIAVFLASDLASAITGVTVDATCGTTAGLNYRATI